MISEAISFREQVIRLAEQYGNSPAFLQHIETDSPVYTNGSAEGGLPERVDPERIDSGISGYIVYLIELYRQTGEHRYEDMADNAIARLVSYCKQTPTDNYAFYTGRAGVVYVLLQRYLDNGDNELIKDALELITPANTGYLHGKYTSDFLYDGRSGTLLVLLHLYLICDEPFLKTYIDQFAAKISANAHIMPDGICWIAEESINLRPSCGFVSGSSGIIYVLQQLSKYAQSDVLDVLTGEATRYKDSCWVDRFNNWGNFEKTIDSHEVLQQYIAAYQNGEMEIFSPRNDTGWAGGTAGILMAHNGSASAKEREAAIETMRISVEKTRDGCLNLYDGLAGIGMYCLTVRNQPAYSAILIEVITALLPAAPDPEIGGGLMYGNTGIVYFLLKSLSPGNTGENLLAPFTEIKDRYKKDRFELDIDLSVITKATMERFYPRTTALLETLNPSKLSDFLHNLECLKHLHDLLQGYTEMPDVYSDKNKLKKEWVEDVFNLERSAYRLFLAENKSSFQIYLDDIIRREFVLERLKKPKEFLLVQKLAMSDKIFIQHSKWDWSFKDDFRQVNRGSFELQDMDADDFRYIMQVNANGGVTELFLKKDLALLLQSFTHPKAVGKVIMEIKQYTQTLSEAELNAMLLTFLETPNTKDFLKQLDSTILYETRQWLYRGILVMVDQ